MKGNPELKNWFNGKDPTLASKYLYYYFRYSCYGMSRGFQETENGNYVSLPKMDRVRKASKVALTMDVYDNTDPTRGRYLAVYVFPSSSPWGVVDTRHFSASNVLYVDGYVNAEKITGSGNKYLYNSTYNPYKFKPFTGGTPFWTPNQ